jgi:hypothetical protein
MNRQRFCSPSLVLSALLAMTLAAAKLPAQTGACSDCTELGRIAAEMQHQADDAATFLSNLPAAQEKVSTLIEEQKRAWSFTDAAAHHYSEYLDLEDQARRTFKKSKDSDDDDRADKYHADAVAAKNERDAQEKRATDLGREINELQAKIQSAKATADKLAQDAQKAWNAYYDCMKRSKCPPANRTATGTVPAAVRLPHDGTSSIKITINNSCPVAEQYGFSSSDLPAGLFEAPDPVNIDTGGTRDVALPFNAKASGPGLYFGTITVKCLTCDESCPRPEKSVPVVVYAPAE